MLNIVGNMTKYKLIKRYPDSPGIGCIVERYNKDCSWFVISNSPDSLYKIHENMLKHYTEFLQKLD